MAKKEEVENAKSEEIVALEKAPAMMNDSTGKLVSVSDVLAQMEKAEVGMELVSNYLKFEVGQSEKLLFVEMSQIKKINGEEGETTPAVKFVDKHATMRILADAVVVSFFTTLANQGKSLLPFQIECIGLKGPKGREYREFSIKPILL